MLTPGRRAPERPGEPQDKLRENFGKSFPKTAPENTGQPPQRRLLAGILFAMPAASAPGTLKLAQVRSFTNPSLGRTVGGP